MKNTKTLSLLGTLALTVVSASALTVSGNTGINLNSNLDNTVKTDLNSNSEIKLDSGNVNNGNKMMDNEERKMGEMDNKDNSEVLSDVDLSTKFKKQDDKISNVEVNDDQVSLQYKSLINLFGLFPIFVNTTASVKTNGETQISYPWYAAFASTDEENLTAKVKNSVVAYTSTQGEANSKLSSSAKVQILAKIYQVLKADFNANMNGNSQVSGDGR